MQLMLLLPMVWCWNGTTSYESSTGKPSPLQASFNHSSQLPSHSSFQLSLVRLLLGSKSERPVLALPVVLASGTPYQYGQGTACTFTTNKCSTNELNYPFKSIYHLGECLAAQQTTKARLPSHKCTQQKEAATYLQDQLPSTLQCPMELSQ